MTQIQIASCIGCGAMREDERCERCTYRRVELVDADDLDVILERTLAARRSIDACAPVVERLRSEQPRAGEFERALTELAQTARDLHARFGAEIHDELPPEADVTVVWRCQVCGAVDEPQECLGICIWHRFEWADAGSYQAARGQLATTEAEARIARDLVALVAFTQPRPGTWEANWRALQAKGHAIDADR